MEVEEILAAIDSMTTEELERCVEVLVKRFGVEGLQAMGGRKPKKQLRVVHIGELLYGKKYKDTTPN